jgi:predicted nucleic acid-binding Zn ribbon protein
VQDGLGLVVGRVGHKYMPCPCLLGHIAEELVAESASSRFEPLPGRFVTPRLHGQLSPYARNPEPFGQKADKLAVGRGLVPQIVFGMSHQEWPHIEPHEPDKKRDAVGPARNPGNEGKSTRAADR